MKSVNLSAQKSTTVVETKIELDSHEDTCVLDDQFLIIHDHNRPGNALG